jgi:hypothetical protein
MCATDDHIELVEQTRRRLAPAARGGIPVESRIQASERTSQKLNELLEDLTGVADPLSQMLHTLLARRVDGDQKKPGSPIDRHARKILRGRRFDYGEPRFTLPDGR